MRLAMTDTTDLIARLRRIAKVSYGATIEEGREVSKTQREAADALTRLSQRIAAIEAELAARESAQPVSAIWEYRFIHSSATGRGETKVGPCLTYSREQAFGVGCIEQRLIRQPAAAASEDTQDAGNCVCCARH
jgi:hypothetical protein